jgi:hypothetical protein
MEFANSIFLYNKTIGTISSANLIKSDICIPDIQRLENSETVQDIVNYQINHLRDHNQVNFIGVLNIHYIQDKDEYFLVDGQHRYAAIKKLHQLGHLFHIVIELIKVSSMKELQHNYSLVNKNTPLPQFPTSIDKNIPEVAALHFKTSYPTIWSKNSRARKPHIYWNFFQEALGRLTKELQIQSSKELIDTISDFNNQQKELIEKGITTFLSNKVSDKVLSKCKTTGFYLGLNPHVSDKYGYEWIRKIIELQTGIAPKKQSKPRKKTIPKKIKNDAWNTYNGSDKGDAPCWCCGDSINSKTFHAGHIISEKNKGTCTIDNILPICAGCNLSMGSSNMEDFISQHYPLNLNRFQKRNSKPTNGWSMSFF